MIAGAERGAMLIEAEAATVMRRLALAPGKNVIRVVAYNAAELITSPPPVAA